MLKRILPVVTALLFLSVSGLPAQGNRGITTTPSGAYPPLKVGRQVLVVIAVSRYEQWVPLTTPVVEAKEIRDTLLSRYRVDQMYELYDEEATKANIMRLLARLQDDLTPDDSLLILYCGHGYLDKKSSSGFWIPVNAGTDAYEQINWLSHSQLKGLLANVPATHLLVISDSCFAGDLLYATRSIPLQAEADYFRRSYSRVSRLVLTSGATEPVPDVSDFARQLELVLSRNESPLLDAYMLYNEIRLGVSSVLPLLGALSGTGHQDGASFLLFLREDVARSRVRSGNLKVESDRGGVLFLDSVRWGDMDKGAVELNNLDAGEHLVRIAYPDGSFDERAVTVEERSTETVFFIAREGPAHADAVRAGGGFISAGGGLWGVFPVAGVAGVLGIGPSVLSNAHYNFRTSWADFGVGLMTGALWLSTLDGMAYDYDMLSFPVALDLRVRTRDSSPLSFSLELAAGIMISSIQIHDIPPSETASTDAFVAPSVEIGLRLFDHFRVVANAGFLAIFFKSSPFTGISLGTRIEYVFAGPEPNLR